MMYEISDFVLCALFLIPVLAIILIGMSKHYRTKNFAICVSNFDNFLRIRFRKHPFAFANLGVPPQSFQAYLEKNSGRTWPLTEKSVAKAMSFSLTSWNGLGCEPSHRRAMFAILAYAAVVKNDAKIAKMRDYLAYAFNVSGYGDSISFDPGLDHSERLDKACDEVFDHVFNGTNGDYFRKLIDTKSKKHGWSQTIAMSLLEDARKKTILPATYFSWLRVIDRPMFFALNALGRPSHLPEGIAAACQYDAEVKAGCVVELRNMNSALAGLGKEGWLELGGDISHSCNESFEDYLVRESSCIDDFQPQFKIASFQSDKRSFRGLKRFLFAQDCSGDRDG